jgi:transposase
VSDLLLLDPTPLPEGLGIPAADWRQTPTSGRHQCLALLTQVDSLEARLQRDSSSSSRPPSTDALSTKRQRRTKAAERRKPGAKPGHPGHPQMLLEPTATVALCPETCPCGHPRLSDLGPSHTHQVIALPVIRPEVTHGIRPQGRCLSWGALCKATVPSEQVRGYGPRLTGFVGERAGMVGASRRAVQDLWASVLSIPLRKGVMQKMGGRVAEAILPHDRAIGEVARPSLGNSLDETAWLMHGDRHWLWVMANPAVASFQIHRHRSKAAFAQLMGDWTGLLVSDGDGVSQSWEGLRQSCLAHLIRTANGLAESVPLWDSGARGRRASARWSTNTPRGRTKPGHVPDVWSEQGSRCGWFWTSRVSKRPITWRSAPTASASCGANAARDPAARRAIAGWSGSYPCVTRVASEDVRHCRFWSVRSQVCAKARDLS